MIESLINHWRFFKQYGDNSEALLPIAHVHYIYMRMKYGFGVREYFDNKLWDTSLSHDEFYENLQTYIHKWNYVSKHYAPTNKKYGYLFIT